MDINNEKIEKMRRMVKVLNEATAAYNEGHPCITDELWDSYYWALLDLEKELGMSLEDSPTKSIYNTTVDSLKKVKHDHEMLSLAKTKSIDEVLNFANKSTAMIAMAKMDGLTCSLTYENGFLVRAETRGDGQIGEDITHCARVVKNIPTNIGIKERLVVDGEIICRFEDFESMFAQEYSNPRNFAAGSIRQMSANESMKRHLTFVAWDLISLEGDESYDGKSLSNSLWRLSHLGFTTVPMRYWFNYKIVEGERVSQSTIAEDIEICIKDIKEEAKENSYPIDGIVFKYDVISEYLAAGKTSHHFSGGLAYKFYEDDYETTLLNIDYDVSRNGVLTPVAVFEPVDIDGAIVNRASLHNLTVMYDIFGGIPYRGQKIKVYRANEIIPQIRKVNPEEYDITHDINDNIPYPAICPVCGGRVSTYQMNEAKVLKCENPDCPRKNINILDHYCCRKNMDIRGLSKKTLEKLIDYGWLNKISDIYSLKEHRQEWIKKEGFGPASVDKILSAIEESKNCDLYKFIGGLGIPLVGINTAKDLCKNVKSYEDFRDKVNNKWDFTSIDNFGEVIAESILNYDYSEADIIAQLLVFNPIVEDSSHSSNKLSIVVCVTGKLEKFKSRDELKALIEAAGGKVTESVTKRTSYLICNEVSSSAKCKKAATLGVPIITESDFLKKFDL